MTSGALLARETVAFSKWDKDGGSAEQRKVELQEMAYVALFIEPLLCSAEMLT